MGLEAARVLALRGFEVVFERSALGADPSQPHWAARWFFAPRGEACRHLVTSPMWTMWPWKLVPWANDLFRGLGLGMRGGVFISPRGTS